MCKTCDSDVAHSLTNSFLDEIVDSYDEIFVDETVRQHFEPRYRQIRSSVARIEHHAIFAPDNNFSKDQYDEAMHEHKEAWKGLRKSVRQYIETGEIPRNRAPGVQIYECEYCGYEFNNKRKYNYHLERRHPEELGIERDSNPAAEEQLNYDPEAKQLYYEPVEQEKLQEVYLEESPPEWDTFTQSPPLLPTGYVCPECPSDVFPTKEGFEIHYTKTHGPLP